MSMLNIPIPNEVQQDLRNMIARLAHEVIQEVKIKETVAKDYMNIKEACKYMGISFVTFQNWQKLGLKTITIEGKKLVKKETIDEFMRTYEK